MERTVGVPGIPRDQIFTRTNYNIIDAYGWFIFEIFLRYMQLSLSREYNMCVKNIIYEIYIRWYYESDRWIMGSEFHNASL